MSTHCDVIQSIEEAAEVAASKAAVTGRPQIAVDRGEAAGIGRFDVEEEGEGAPATHRVCVVHRGAPEGKGGYCARWASDPGHGPCVLVGVRVDASPAPPTTLSGEIEGVMKRLQVFLDDDLLPTAISVEEETLEADALELPSWARWTRADRRMKAAAERVEAAIESLEYARQNALRAEEERDEPFPRGSLAARTYRGGNPAADGEAAARADVRRASEED